jgi:hypothetical protein
MRQTLGVIAASVIITAGIAFGSAQAGFLESLGSLIDETVDTKTYTVEAKGWNLRAYAWIDPASGLYCLYVAGENKGGLSCNKVERK